MNIIVIIIFLAIINLFNSIDINYSKYKLKIYGFKFLVYKKNYSRKLIKVLNSSYNKSIVCLAEKINDYNNNFTEEEKIIIETILSLCY
jgi:hypothetical protein